MLEGTDRHTHKHSGRNEIAQRSAEPGLCPGGTDDLSGRPQRGVKQGAAAANCGLCSVGTVDDITYFGEWRLNVSNVTKVKK